MKKPRIGPLPDVNEPIGQCPCVLYPVVHETIRLTVYGQPTSKKNSMRFIRTRGCRGRVALLPSREFCRWVTIAREQVMAQLAGVKGLPITYPVHLKVLAFRHTRRKIDLSNIYAAVEDMLQKYGVLKDDELVQSHDGSRKFLGVPEDEARVEIELEEMA